jgi:DNA repair exonuclease SbcCD ATPase subunit
LSNGAGSFVFAAVSLALAIGGVGWAVREHGAVTDLTAQLATASAQVADVKAQLQTANQNAEQMREELNSETSQLANVNTQLQTTSTQLQSKKTQLASSSAAAKASQAAAKVAEARLLSSAEAAKAAAAEAQAAEAKLAQAERPDLPVRVGFRRGLLGGIVMVLQNYSGRSLDVETDLQDGTAHTHAGKAVTLDPNKVQRLGKAEGWNIAPGAIVRLSNPQFRPMEKTVDAISVIPWN